MSLQSRVMPHFAIPWPARINPEVEDMRRHSLAWALIFGIVADDESAERLDAARFDRLAGYAHPEARGAGAELSSDWMVWFFPFDDLFDGPVGEDPAQVSAVVQPMIEYVHGDTRALPFDAPPLIHAFADLCRRSSMGMSSAWRARFAADIGTYLHSYVQESVMRRRAAAPDPEHLLEVRRNAIGIRPSLAFGEAVEHRELALPLALSEPFARLRTLCADLVVVQNDAYSLGKDLAKGELSNQAAASIRDGRETAEQAVRRLERAHDALMEQYLAGEAAAADMPERYFLPEQASQAARYLAATRSWISGNDAWSRETTRYAAAPAQR